MKIFVMIMSIRQYSVFFKKLSPCALMVILAVYFCLFTTPVLAKANNYLLEEVAQLTHVSLKGTHWQQVVVNPNHKQQFFIINELGQLYLVDKTVSARPLLDLNHSRQDRDKLTLTAMVLHPNFSLPHQSGHGIIYTAHLEPINKKPATIRLKERSTDLTLTHDAVITEWKFNTDTFKTIDESTRREVLRIGVPSKDINIKQMSFNSVLKSWNENFGLLYIGLSGDYKRQEPLYSGAVLRINPRKFGLRSYTVPVNNPFLKNKKINDAIYVLGSQKISQFIWPNRASEQLLLVHQYNSKHFISVAKGGNDWRNQVSKKKILYQSMRPIKQVLLYRGSHLPALRNKLLFLQKVNRQWNIYALPVSTVLRVYKEPKKPTLAWQFSPLVLSKTSLLTLSAALSSEVLLLDNTNKLFYRVSQENEPPAVMKSKTQSVEVKPGHNNYILIVLIVLIAISGVFYFLKRSKVSAKTIVRQQYARIELSKLKQQVSLYHRHQVSADTIIDLMAITSSRVLLNEQSICLINHEVDCGFSDKKEQDLRTLFAKERANKMIDGKIRQITLKLVDKQKHTYTICLYMRKGSDRITQNSYVSVIVKLVDWCWLIAQQINPDSTEERKHNVTSTVVEYGQEQDKQEVLLHKQAAIRSVTDKPVSNEEVLDPSESIELVEAVSIAKDNKKEIEVEKQTFDSQEQKKGKLIGTELVNTLEKLVNLKQQGFLTSQEFSQAKAKLFKSLLDNE